MSGAERSLTWEQALSWRQDRHRLARRAAPSDLVAVAGAIAGLHAQVSSAPELALWARIDRLERGAVQAALQRERTLVKLWAMRGTLHLLPAGELGTWLAALGTFSSRGNAGSPEIDRLAGAVRTALDGHPLTREELARAVGELTGNPQHVEWIRCRWGSYLKAAAFRGLLCFAPAGDGRARFTSPANWISGPLDRPEPAEALRTVARRFLSAYAPATLEDVALWWGDGRRAARRMLELLRDEIIEVLVEGERACMLACDLDAVRAAEPARAARLLPSFDPWVMGALIGRRPGLPCRGVLTPPGERRHVFSPQGWVSPVVLVDGRIAGVWRHARQGRDLRVRIAPFARLSSRASEQIEAEAERLALFFDAALSLRWEDPSPGARGEPST